MPQVDIKTTAKWYPVADSDPTEAQRFTVRLYLAMPGLVCTAWDLAGMDGRPSPASVLPDLIPYHYLTEQEQDLADFAITLRPNYSEQRYAKREELRRAFLKTVAGWVAHAPRPSGPKPTFDFDLALIMGCGAYMDEQSEVVSHWPDRETTHYNALSA